MYYFSISSARGTLPESQQSVGIKPHAQHRNEAFVYRLILSHAGRVFTFHAVTAWHNKHLLLAYIYLTYYLGCLHNLFLFDFTVAFLLLKRAMGDLSGENMHVHYNVTFTVK